MSKCGLKSKAECKCDFPMMDGPDPQTCLWVVGASGSGKTRFTVNTLLHKDSPWHDIFIICSKMSCDQKEYKRLKECYKRGKVHMIKGAPEDNESEEELMEEIKKSKTPVVVMDDLLADMKGGRGQKMIQKLMTQGRHLGEHGCGRIVCVQHIGDRVSRLQAGMFALFATPSSADAVAHLARGLSPESKGARVMKAYRDATADKYGYLLVDARPGAKHMMKKSSWHNVYDFSPLAE
jgi:hypothetical protein